MKNLAAAVLTVSLVGIGSNALAQEISEGSRITITSDWHDANGGPYSPRVVSCSSDSGLCLRDSRLSPADRAMQKTGNGLQVSYQEFGIIYLFRSGGAGTFFNMNGEQVGTFNWTQ